MLRDVNKQTAHNFDAKFVPSDCNVAGREGTGFTSCCSPSGRPGHFVTPFVTAFRLLPDLVQGEYRPYFAFKVL